MFELPEMEPLDGEFVFGDNNLRRDATVFLVGAQRR